MLLSAGKRLPSHSTHLYERLFINKITTYAASLRRPALKHRIGAGSLAAALPSPLRLQALSHLEGVPVVVQVWRGPLHSDF